jgi:hypothetical protein
MAFSHSANLFRILHELTLPAFAQPYGLQRLSPRSMSSGQPASILRDESSLILWIP